MKKWFGYGGIAASVVLIAFGIAAIAMGVNGYSTVRDSLAAEKIVGCDDMSPTLIQKGIEEAGLSKTDAEFVIPSKDIVGEPIDTGAEAKAFAGYMRIHALESGGGKTYAQMGRFLTPDGKDTSDEALAAKDPETGRPVPNRARDTWVTETALSTALNTAYFAEQVALFSIVMGVALLLTGIGFLVLTLGGALGIVPLPKLARAPRGAAPVAT
jgi:hypothetical protein